jgi:hypothetical protein
MAQQLTVGRPPGMPRAPLGGMFAQPQNFGLPMRPRAMAPPKPPPLPSWYPWQRYHQNANPFTMTRALYRAVPSFAAALTPQMHAALFAQHPRLPPSTLIMQAAHPGYINPGLRFGPPSL